MKSECDLGATCLGGDTCGFLVWAPLIDRVEVHILFPEERIAPLEKVSRGYHQGVVRGVKPGTRYFYRLDGDTERPDPASRFQPEGVHGPSQVIDPHFVWDGPPWPGMPLSNYVLYELHVGTYTVQGTFEAVVPHLDELKDLGITSLEIMPVAQFPGDRNWGYDGVYPFAVQNSYGGPEGLKRLVSACHQRGLAVTLDVVYNHLGPEGNYLRDFGPYFTDRYRTPWGAAINFDGPGSDEVRRFFIQNALYWVTEFRVDALRLDAVHGIFDFSALHFLQELACAVHARAERLNRRIQVIAESDLNDARLVHSQELGGYGLDAQWNDDFHHALHTLLTGERTGYYEDFGRIQDLAKAFAEGFVYSGAYSPARRRRHGNTSKTISAGKLVVFAQNHDQVGNRPTGDRLGALVSFESLKLAAAVVLLSPFIPLLFMGEEYGETAPFPYFVSHSDPDLREAVRRGRRQEFAYLQGSDEPPDPQEEATRQSATLDHSLRDQGNHRILYQWYKELIKLRGEIQTFAGLSKDRMEVVCLERENTLVVRRWGRGEHVAAIFHFGAAALSVDVPLPYGRWLKRLASGEKRWNGPGDDLPALLHSDGKVSLTLTKYALLVVTLQPED
ncbi:MAG: malto-oligosyltrehalose trehalohydrolase [Syntrophobacteraceae bacterium]